MSRHTLPTTLPEVDVRALNRQGLLRPGMLATVSKSFAGRVVCTAEVVALGDDEVAISAGGRVARVDLVYTPQRLGGHRVWFSCPRCQRRAAILYPFACRKCCSITYPSQREAPHHRAIRRAQVLRICLGGSGKLAEPLPPRPWGMWDRTYRRRVEACRRAEAWSLAGMSAALERLRRSFARPAAPR